MTDPIIDEFRRFSTEMQEQVNDLTMTAFLSGWKHAVEAYGQDWTIAMEELAVQTYERLTQ